MNWITLSLQHVRRWRSQRAFRALSSADKHSISIQWHRAVEDGDVSTLTRLLPNTPSLHLTQALTRASVLNHALVVDLIINSRPQDTTTKLPMPLLCATIAGNLDLLPKLLEGYKISQRAAQNMVLSSMWHHGSQDIKQLYSLLHNFLPQQWSLEKLLEMAPRVLQCKQQSTINFKLCSPMVEVALTALHSEHQEIVDVLHPHWDIEDLQMLAQSIVLNFSMCTPAWNYLVTIAPAMSSFPEILKICVDGKNKKAFDLFAWIVPTINDQAFDLMLAALQEPAPDIFKILCTHHSQLVSQKQWKGLLKVAIMHEPSMCALIWDKFNANTKSNLQDVLAFAAQHQQIEMVKTMLPHCNPKAKNSLALQWACHHENEELFALLYPVSDPAAAHKEMVSLSDSAEDIGLYNTVEDRGCPTNANWLIAHMKGRQIATAVQPIKATKQDAPKRRM